MVQVSPRTSFSGSALIRLLARLAELDVPDSRPSLVDRLSQWLGWTDAIALSAALNASPKTAPAGTREAPMEGSGECARLRGSLAGAIAQDSAFQPARSGGRGPHARHAASVALITDFAFYRERYLSKQQAMEVAIAASRANLRTALATKSSELARLAAVDAVMERVLGAQERNLLAAVPGLLEGHFERLRRAGEETADAGEGPAPSPQAAAGPVRWLDAFRQDMQQLLMAELDFRLQPVEGLAAALRQS
ncbi:MAG: DUF3348 domain-containing protein [Pigmentiphaga sp.]|uniref:DUF3348 domain-containing protein n=1 Tax=Pigmentiphaga sp. TaxID=1977564 RepID=UPI0029A2F912|nr:DUF3348 domain-containing protein [Pigmentiphaga sp.]MDX3905151.1 DUF3348 domain-containing protein [Pigmentiphaga sp.]